MNKQVPTWVRDLAIAKRVPLAAHVDLTFACNEQCLHCCRLVENRMELSTDEVFKLLDALRELGCLFLTFSGGELTLRPDLWPILAEARRQRFSVRIKSNLIALDDQGLERLSALHLTTVETSLYGAIAATHDQITGVPGSWAKTTQNIQRLTGLGVPVDINCSAMTLNKDEIPQLRSLCEELGACRTDVDVVIRPQAKLDTHNCRFNLSPADAALIQLPEPDQGLHPQPMVDKKDTNIVNQIEVMCGAGHILVYINPYGDVAPCVAFPLFCGNLRELSLGEIWTASEALCHYRSFEKKDRQRCPECGNKDSCNFCPGLAYMTQENFLAPVPETCERAGAIKERKDSFR